MQKNALNAFVWRNKKIMRNLEIKIVDVIDNISIVILIINGLNHPM